MDRGPTPSLTLGIYWRLTKNPKALDLILILQGLDPVQQGWGREMLNHRMTPFQTGVILSQNNTALHSWRSCLSIICCENLLKYGFFKWDFLA